MLQSFPWDPAGEIPQLPSLVAWPSPKGVCHLGLPNLLPGKFATGSETAKELGKKNMEHVHVFHIYLEKKVEKHVLPISNANINHDINNFPSNETCDSVCVCVRMLAVVQAC